MVWSLRTVEIDEDASKAAIHDSFGDMLFGIYRAIKLFRAYYRTIGTEPAVVGKTTTTTINETIDASVFDRWQNDAGYRPASLVDWAERRRADMNSIHNSVRADDEGGATLSGFRAAPLSRSVELWLAD